MSEKLKDTAIDLLLDGVKKKIDDMRDNHKWQELFVNTGHFFINNSDMVTRFESDLYLVFSEDNLKTLAKKLRNKSGYEFPELLHEELYDLMIRYEIPAMQAETHIHHFMKVIINYLEENDPDRALELYLGHLKKEIDQNFSTIEEKFELVLSKIAELNEAKVVLYSVSDIDVQIRRMSKYKGMGLDFFELDDEQFELRFQSAINKELIYIVGKSREETTYRILNELRQKYPDRVTLIVKSEAEWSKLQETGISGNILVPFFYAEQIVAIPNNNNIFVYGEDEPCYARNKIILRRRTKHITDLCEASPESVLRKLNDELEHPQGMVELFEENDGDIITGRHYYTNVLWAVEQLIQQKKYVVQAVEWLWKVDSYNLKYSISNSPRTVLDIVFCAWLNECALSVDEKIRLQKKQLRIIQMHGILSYRDYHREQTPSVHR